MKPTLIISIFMLSLTVAQAVEPVDRNLIPEARAVLNYLESVYGKKTLAGGNGPSIHV